MTLRTVLLVVASILLSLAGIAFGVVALCYPDLAQKIARFNATKWTHATDAHAWDTRLIGLMLIIFFGAMIISQLIALAHR
jgi:hypothetical protein